MTDPEQPPEIEDLLRRALQEEAARIHPMGDGLERIRARVGRRRPQLSWLRPVLGVVAAIAVVAGAVTLPVLLRSGNDAAPTAGRGGALSRASASPASPTSPTDTTLGAQQQTAPSATGRPGSADGSADGSPQTGEASPSGTVIDGDPYLPDMTTVWPYSSRSAGAERADRDVADGTRPRLRDAHDTALDFVRSFVDGGDRLTADAGRQMQAGIGVTVSVEAGGLVRPVSVVYLVRVRKADDSPYVVVNASTPVLKGDQSSMSVDPGRLNGTDEMTVTGTLVQGRDQPAVATVKVALHEPGQDTPIAAGSPVPEPGLDGSERRWSVGLAPIHELATPTGTVAAWTVDAGNHLLDFVAAPTDQ